MRSAHPFKSLLFLIGAFICVSSVTAEAQTESSAAKRRPAPNKNSPNYYMICQREREYRLSDYMESLTEKEIAEYRQKAEQGDTEAMYFLMRVLTRDSEGRLTSPYRQEWMDKAVAAGHPLARYLKAGPELVAGKISHDEYLAITEAAAQSNGGLDLAWRLGLRYASQDDLHSPLKTGYNPQKAFYWTKFAAERGHTAAAEELCAGYHVGIKQYGIEIDYAEALRWCTAAAQASCSHKGSYILYQLYRDGKGVPKDMVEAYYWKRVSDERLKREKKYQGEYDMDGENRE